MMNLLIMLFLIIIICSLLISLLLILSKKSSINLEKMSSFECGFNPMFSARLPFSIHFFMLTIIFLIFDVEITLIMPLIMSWNNCNLNYWFLTNLFFFTLLLIGLFHEWNQNMINWTS